MRISMDQHIYTLTLLIILFFFFVVSVQALTADFAAPAVPAEPDPAADDESAGDEPLDENDDA